MEEAVPIETPVSEPGVTFEEPQEEAVKPAEKTPAAPAREKKTRIQVDPNACAKYADENVHYLTALPVVAEAPKPYTPILYTFRVKTRGRNTNLKNVTTKPPPFYLQFDHAIAVIWTLFNKGANRDNLGIVQLQWALHFLHSIQTSEGGHPKDIQLCIDTIQDYLIDEYADISEESVMYGAPKIKDEEKAEVADKNASFSFNYSQMIRKCPGTAVATTASSALLDKQLLQEFDNVRKAAGIESIDLTNVVSKDQVMDILGDWKKEQIEKIQEELKMLYVVEDMMKNSDSQNFEGYTDEKQFETIFRRNYEKTK